MLHFILGRAASGKTTYLHKKLGEIVSAGAENTILIVPEQFTFETDKGILEALGAVNSNKIEVLSFTRLAESVFSHYGKMYKEALSDQGRILYMSLALESVQDKLSIYRKHVNNSAFIQNMLLVVDEFKQSSSEKSIDEVINSLENSFLKSKMSELKLICDAYDAIVSVNHSDAGDSIANLSELLKTENYFKGKTVAVDGFTSFNGQVMKLLEKIIVQADDVYVSICADSISYNEYRNDVFAFTSRTVNRLRRIAEKNCVSVAKPIVINESLTGYSKYTADGMETLDKNLYKPDSDVYDGDVDFINIYGASDVEDECGFVARKIRQLLRSGYRCRDIAVIYRDADKYETELRYAFRKYSIPVFEDARQPIKNQPLVLFIQNALKICADGFNTENILRYMKTGITGVSVDDVSLLENYVYMWGIDGVKWKTDWEFSPYAFRENKNRDEGELLEKINGIRSRIIQPLINLRAASKGKNAKEISALVYDFLIETDTAQHLKELAINLENDGEFSLALEQEQIWDMLMEILNEIGVSLENSYPDMKKYLDFFNLSLSVRSLGRIPTGIDEVIVGSADKIRSRNIRVVFVVGLNAGVFPKLNASGGLITERDRNKLLETGLELYDINKYKTLEERFIAYNAVCCANERIFLSYALTGSKDEKLLPGEIITMVKKILPGCKETFREDIKPEEYIEGEAAAFELYAGLIKEGGYYCDNLGAYFANNPVYGSRIESLRRVSSDFRFEIADKAVSTELFGKRMYLSATKIEDYEKCPFLFYCKYGIRALPRDKAELDPSQSGTIVHYVLQKLVEKYSADSMKKVDEEECRKDIKAALYSYADSFMGGMDDKEKRFAYHFDRLAKTIFVVLERIFTEFENSDFLPCDFELKIGNDGKIKPYRVELENGGVVEIIGSVDRVDIMKTDRADYLRVVDYKTGTKEMYLSDVMNGLNMQMLIYLMAIWKNGKTYYGDKIVPAGVLYLPASFTHHKAERGADEEEINRTVLKNGKMNGLLLDDTRVIKGMDCSGDSLFIPAKIDEKTGRVKGNVISLSQLEALNKRIDGIISDMAISLHNGKIWANPVYGKKHDNTCEYCDYHSVCCYENKGYNFRYAEFSDHAECLEILNGGENNGKKLD